MSSATKICTVAEVSLWSCIKMTSEEEGVPCGEAARTLSPISSSEILTAPLPLTYTWNHKMSKRRSPRNKNNLRLATFFQSRRPTQAGAVCYSLYMYRNLPELPLVLSKNLLLAFRRANTSPSLQPRLHADLTYIHLRKKMQRQKEFIEGPQ